MKKSTGIILLLFLFLSAIVYGNKKFFYCHKKSTIFLQEYLDIITKSDSIEWFIFDPMAEDSVKGFRKDYGEILVCKYDTVIDRCNAIKNTLIYDKSFVKDSMVKESTFLPDIAVNFYYRENLVTFSYSFYCDLCKFEMNGKYHILNGELIRNSIITIVSEIFPKDRYIRQIKRKKK